MMEIEKMYFHIYREPKKDFNINKLVWDYVQREKKKKKTKKKPKKPKKPKKRKPKPKQFSILDNIQNVEIQDFFFEIHNLKKVLHMSHTSIRLQNKGKLMKWVFYVKSDPYFHLGNFF